MNLLTPPSKAYPQYATQRRDSFWQKVSDPSGNTFFNSGGSSTLGNTNGFRLFDGEAEFFVDNTSSSQWRFVFDVDLTHMTVFKFDSRLVNRAAGSIIISVNNAATLFSTSANHPWTTRITDVSGYTGVQEIHFVVQANSGEFSIRNARLY